MGDEWFWQDVEFNHTHATEAVSQLRSLKSYVESLIEVRAVAADEPLVDWIGRFRDDFDDEFVVTQGGLEGVVDQIDALITSINNGAELAEASQSVRETLRIAAGEGEG